MNERIEYIYMYVYIHCSNNFLLQKYHQAIFMNYFCLRWGWRWGVPTRHPIHLSLDAYPSSSYQRNLFYTPCKHQKNLDTQAYLPGYATYS